MTAVARMRVTDRVHVFTLGGETMLTSYGANATAVLADGAVLLVDPFIAPAHARLLETSLREVTADPVRFVVLSHHHTDHALGSGYFAGQGAVVISHERCAKRMAKEHPGLIEARRKEPALAALFRDAAATPPGATFETWVPLSFGGISLEVRHAGHAHTPGDAFVHVPGERVVIAGDLVSNGYHVNYEDALPAGLRGSLDILLSLRAERFIPGHGKPGGREIVETQVRYHETVAATVRAAGRKDAAAALRKRFPGYLLEEVLPTASAAFAA